MEKVKENGKGFSMHYHPTTNVGEQKVYKKTY